MSRTATSIVALLAGLMWPGGPVPAHGVSVFPWDSPQIIAMTLRHDPDDDAEDDEDDEDDFEDDEDIGHEDDEPDDEDDVDEDDELDDDDSSGHGSDDDDDEDDEDNSGHGSDDEDEDDEDDDSSGHGSDDDDDEDDKDNSGHGADDDAEKDDEDNSGRSHSDDDDDDNSGRSHGDDDDDIYEEFIDDDGFRAVDDEFLVLVSRSDLEDGKFDKADFEIQHDLTALDMVMLRVRIDEDDDLAVRMQERAVGGSDATVDLNHYYAPDYGPGAQDDRLARDERKEPLFVPAGNPPASNPLVSNPMALPTVLAASLGLDMARDLRGRVGMIDTTVNMGHSALAGASVTVQDFASRGNPPLSDHGTMIASILVGSEPGAFLGIAPNYEILAANVFFQKPDGQVLASVESLILALEWLVAEDVQVINMSLSGPPNRLLERAISQARTGGTIVVAAVGNGGPAAKPLYPAAYGEVVAVTAVDRRMNIYMSAGRGGHLDFAAPGVDMLTAKAQGGFGIRSGTSLAAPFVTIVLSEMRQRSTMSWPEILAALEAGAQDLGEAGFDPVFGYGLIQAKR